MRDQLEKDFLGTLHALADLGLSQVELFRFTSDSAPTYDRALGEAGLTAPTAHAGFLDLGDQDEIFAAAAEVGVGTLILPNSPEERWIDTGGLDRLSADLNAAAARAARYGISVGYHNHWWEIETTVDGVTALEAFATRLDDRIVLEIDAYWAEAAGARSAELIERLGNRVVALHVKDGDLSRDTRKQVPAGQGRLPVLDILAAAPAALCVVEFDAYAGDSLEGVAASVAFLRAQGLR
ncbi:sugar phosphate isomerase/epimerase family protein [Jiangella endophytica]|uniref:sugar phosphate isomerase/epimerase family protein n=1 Tax=Jiangella endophytica TaxID=1623398 RepID=UPI0018E53D49|nr:sugar phosphate isomerase/epimerase [Jiangella endophytica]